MRHRLILAFAVLGLAACKPAETIAPDTAVSTDGTPSAIRATDAWCRPSPAGAQAGACYLTLESSDGDRLTGVATPVSSATQIHEMKTEDETMSMSEVRTGLPLPAGQAVAMAPGSRHLMLVGLTAPLVAGTPVPLTLGFEKSPAVTVQAEVRAPTPPPAATPAPRA